MKRLICVSCGAGEDLNDPTGNIHTMQLVDMTPTYAFAPAKGPDKAVEEDLCGSCRDKLRREFFGVVDAELMEMPLMQKLG
jgi:hypothetical protein